MNTKTVNIVKIKELHFKVNFYVSLICIPTAIIINMYYLVYMLYIISHHKL